MLIWGRLLDQVGSFFLTGFLPGGFFSWQIFFLADFFLANFILADFTSDIFSLGTTKAVRWISEKPWKVSFNLNVADEYSFHGEKEGTVNRIENRRRIGHARGGPWIIQSGVQSDLPLRLHFFLVCAGIEPVLSLRSSSACVRGNANPCQSQVACSIPIF